VSRRAAAVGGWRAISASLSYSFRPGQLQRRGQALAQPAASASSRLHMPLQRAAQHRFEAPAAFGEVAAQRMHCCVPSGLSWS
jgi:hypothetical protein